MLDITFEELLQAVKQLPKAQKSVLIESLRTDVEDVALTREQALLELHALRLAGAFQHVESLYGKYENPDLDITNDELNTYLHSIGKAWEDEIDDIFTD